MKRLWIALVVLSAIAEGAFAQAEVKVAAIEYPPYLSASLPGGGLSIELLQAALKAAGYKVVPDFLPPARATVEFTAARYAVSLFSGDYSKNPEIVQVRNINTLMTFFYNKAKGEVAWTSLADLKGKRMGTTRMTGGGASGVMKPILDAGVLADENDNIEDAFKKLAAGRVDIVFSVDLSGVVIAQRLFPGETNIVMAKKPYMVVAGGPYFNTKAPGGEKLSKDFAAGWAVIARDGTALAILEKYFGKGKVPSETLIK